MSTQRTINDAMYIILFIVTHTELQLNNSHNQKAIKRIHLKFSIFQTLRHTQSSHKMK